MMTRFVVTPLAICLTCLSAAAQESSAAKLFPPSTIAFFQWDQPDQLVGTVFDHPLRQRIEALPPYQTATETAQYRQFQVGLRFLEAHFGMPWREAIETITANGISIGFDAATEGVALVIEGRDSGSMIAFRDKLVALAESNTNGPEIKSTTYRDVTAYRIGQARLAFHEHRMLVTNKDELGKGILDRLIAGNGQSLADNPRFQLAAADQSGDQAAWAFVDVEVIRGSGQADGFYHNQIDNPVLELLLGGIQSTLRETPYLTLALNAKPSGIQLALKMPYQNDWIDDAREYYFGPGGEGRAPEIPNIKDTLLTLSTYRNFSEMWLRAGDLFGQRINDGFAQADANLTTLFAGRDFGEDILGSLQPEFGLVVVRQDLSEVLPRPIIKLPAFAIVTELREPETMTRELRRIFQSLIGFLNVVGAMNGQNQLELEMEKFPENIELISSSFVPEEDDRDSTQAKIIFNFSPSVAFSGSRFVVSSSKSLAAELISAKPAAKSTSDQNTKIALQTDILRDVLADNRGQLIAQNMLKDGNTREEAEAIIDLVLEVVGYFENASLQLAADNETLGVEFAIQVKP